MMITSKLYFIIISFILFILIIKFIEFLARNNYIVECFTEGPISEEIDGSTSHTVDLPLTTTYSCKNFCGYPARCYITGQQCTADIDCPGCQPYKSKFKKNTNDVQGDNDAGKLTLGVTPTYSPLTSGYGTHQKIITTNMYSKPYMPNFGVNTWIDEFNEDQTLFNKRYKPPNIMYMPDYQQIYSLTGEFIEDGPFASNAFIPENSFNK